MTAPARYRRPARRTRRRRTHPAGVIGVVAVLAWGGDALYRLVAVHAEASIAAVVLAVVAAGLAAGVRWQLSRRREQVRIHRTHALDEILALDSTSFEFFTADLLRRDGCTRVRRVGGAGDLAADNLARLPDGRKLLVQDKFYALGNPVGSGDVQKVGGTWQTIHHADVALVVTTSHFTRAASDYCRRARILMCDREQLAAWAAGGPPPWK
jgi:restriction system protein